MEEGVCVCVCVCVGGGRKAQPAAEEVVEEVGDVVIVLFGEEVVCMCVCVCVIVREDHHAAPPFYLYC